MPCPPVWASNRSCRFRLGGCCPSPGAFPGFTPLGTRLAPKITPVHTCRCLWIPKPAPLPSTPGLPECGLERWCLLSPHVCSGSLACLFPELTSHLLSLSLSFRPDVHNPSSDPFFQEAFLVFFRVSQLRSDLLVNRDELCPGPEIVSAICGLVSTSFLNKAAVLCSLWDLRLLSVLAAGVVQYLLPRIYILHRASHGAQQAANA